MNEFLMEEEIIIQQESYIELSPIETFIPVAYFISFMILAGIIYSLFPAKEEKSAALPLGIIGGTFILLFKIYIVSSIDGFDLILQKETIFPFNLLSILGIYFGLTLGFLYSSKSRSWNYKVKEKPILNVKRVFLLILIIFFLGYILNHFYKGFKIKNKSINTIETNDPPKQIQDIIEEDKNIKEEDSNIKEEDSNIKEEDKNIIEKDKNIIEENKNIIEENKKIIEENKKIIEENKDIIEENKDIAIKEEQNIMKEEDGTIETKEKNSDKPIAYYHASRPDIHFDEKKQRIPQSQLGKYEIQEIEDENHDNDKIEYQSF